MSVRASHERCVSARASDEGGPRAALEAMATGVPLVSTRVGQAADLVRHGENGWLADVDDPALVIGVNLYAKDSAEWASDSEAV